jgi:predicted ferric reductase
VAGDTPSDRTDRLLTVASLAVTAAVIGAGVWMFAPTPSLPDLSVHIYWYLGRSAGLIAYWLLFLSVALGIAVSSRVFDGVLNRGWVYDIHKFLSIFVLLAMLFHVLILLPDPWAKFTLVQMFVPFKSHYRPTPVAIGTLTLYGSILITASFYLKGFISQKGWRWLHYATFVLFLGALLHGLLSGTDSERPIVQYSYFASAVAVLFLVFFRVLVTRAAAGKPRAEKAAPRPVQSPATAEAT